MCFFRTVVVCKFENNVNLLFDFMFKVLLKVCKEENIKFFWSFGGSKSGMITLLALYRLELSRILTFLLFKYFVKTIESILCLFYYVVRHKWIRQGQLSTAVHEYLHNKVNSVCVCLSVPTELDNRWNVMVLLYNLASHRSWDGRKWEIAPKKIPKKYSKLPLETATVWLPS